MSEVLIIEPIDLNFGAGVPFVTVSEGTGGANLVTADPREVWQGENPAAVKSFTIDLGANTTIDAFYLGNTNADANASMSVITGTAAQGAAVTNHIVGVPMLMGVDDVRDLRGPALYVAPAPIVARYIVVQTYMPGAVNLQIGNLVVGKAFRPTHGREPGESRVPFDTGVSARLGDGSLSTVSGRLISGFKWVFGDLLDADRKALWGIVKRRKTTRPILLIEDAEALSVESIHYGKFTELEPYTRLDPRKTRWAVSVEDWL